MTPLRFLLLFAWLFMIAVALGCYVLHPEWFKVESISDFISEFQTHMLLAYLLISVVRGIFLVPSTPFVLAGVMLFPREPWIVVAISMIGIMAGSAFIYYFTEFLGLDRVLERRFGHRVAKVRASMDRYGFWIVTLWAFFPVVPTDLIAYTAGIVRMQAWKFFLGILTGELPLVALYVCTGKAIRDLLV